MHMQRRAVENLYFFFKNYFEEGRGERTGVYVAHTTSTWKASEARRITAVTNQLL